jgi:DNA-binding MarR family transcriptional regulator
MVRSRSNAVNPLTPDQVEERGVDPLFLVWLLARSTEDLLDSVLAPSGLTADEFAIYSMLRSAGAVTPTELARWMAAPPTTVSSYVKRLQGRGHVIREASAEDRRSYQLRLTPHGEAAHQRAGELFRPIRNEVQTRLASMDADAPAALMRLRTLVDDLRARRT